MGTDCVTIRVIPCMAVRVLQHVIAVSCWIGAPSAIHLANPVKKKRNLSCVAFTRLFR